MATDALEIRISDNASEAAVGLEKLTATLNGLKAATANNAGLKKIQTSLEGMSTALSGLNKVNIALFTKKLAELPAALAPLENLGKNNLSSFVNSLKKIPDLTVSLNVAQTNAFADAINRVAAAVRPLATEMEKIAMGFSAMPKRIQSFVTQMERSGKGATTAAKGYKAAADGLTLLNQKFNLTALYFGMRRIADVLGGFVQSSNDYIENMNLFTVSMGEFADEAYSYAQKAQELMGIDAGQFMRNQGFFMSIASGFGMAGEQASVLSKNLAQLGYDLASFYNSDVDTAMQKLQSGLAGELEPLRRWGFALDQATLQQVAYAHGINMSIREMNQAQKAQIRYIAIMEQSVNAQHDMARTLTTPANAMRIFNQQITLLSRSIGNILIPVLMKVLPYVLAFVKVLRMAGDALASFFGVTLPEIDYDAFGGMSVGIDDTAVAADDLSGNLGEAVKEAKKLLYLIGGFDELNVLPSQNDPTGSSGGGSGAGGVGGVGGAGFEGLELPEYDFLAGLTDQVDALIPKMQELLKWIAAIGAAFLVWKGITAIANLVDWFSKLSPLAQTLVKTLAGLAMAIAGVVIYAKSFADAWENGINWKNLIGMVGGAALVMAGLSLAISPLVGGLAGLAGGLGIVAVAIRDIVKNGASLKNVTALIAGMAVSIAGIITANKKWMAVLSPLTGAVDAFRYGFSGLTKSMANGTPLFKALGTSLKDTRKYFQEVAGPAATAAAAFVVLSIEAVALFNIFKWATKDIDKSGVSFTNLGVALVSLTAIVAATSAALWVLGMSIPGAIAVAAVVALGAAVLGYASAQKELREAAIEASFFDEQGIAVGALADEFEGLMNAVLAANQPVIDGWAAIQSGVEPIDSVNREFEALRLEVGANATSMEDAIPRMIELVDQLETDTKDQLFRIRDNITTAIAGGFGDSLESMGHSRTEIVAGIHGITTEAVAMVDEITAQLDAYDAKWAQSGSLTTEEWGSYTELVAQLGGILGTTDQSMQGFESALSRATSGIDWGTASTDEMNAALETMGTAYTDAQSSIADYTTSLTGSLEEQQRLAEMVGNTAEVERIQALIDAVPQYEAAQLQALNATLSEYMNVMQADLATGAQDTWNNALNDFDALSAVERMFYGSAENYAAEMVKTYNSTVIEPFSEGVNEQFGNALGDTAWIATVMDDLVSSMQSHLFWRMPSGLEETMRDSISESVATLSTTVPGVTEALGQDFVDGFLSPIEAADASAAAGNMVQGALDAIPATQQSSSPSRITTGFGEDYVEGYVQGIEDNISNAAAAATRLAEETLRILGDRLSSTQTQPLGKTIIDGITSGVTQNQQALITAATSMTDTINKKFQNEFATSKTSQYGRTAAQGIQQGIQQSQNLVVNAAQTLANGTLQRFQQYLNQSKGQQYGREIAQGIANGVNQNSYSLTSAMDDIGRQLSRGLQNIISDLQRQAAANPITITIQAQTTPYTANTRSGGYTGRRFATGGVVSSPTFGLMGEYPGASSNPEIIAPQKTLIESVQEANGPGMAQAVALLARIAMATENNEGFTLQIGDEEIARASNSGNQKLDRVTGRGN